MAKKKKFRKIHKYDEGGDVTPASSNGGGAQSAQPGVDFRQSIWPEDRTSPDQGPTPAQQRVNDWARAVAERSPESENVRDMRNVPGYNPGDPSATTWKERLSDAWQRLQQPFDPREAFRIPGFQAGGEVGGQRSTHALRNDSNRRMVANAARRDPYHAVRLLQGLRREHNGLRALGAAALAHAHGARAVGRHELAHGHDAFALHLLNHAHAKVPDGAEVNFTQHGDHHFNANVKRNGRESNHPLNRQQMLQWAIGPAGGFDHSLDNGVEKNLGILTRPRMGPVRGYQEGGEVEDYADPMSGYQMQSPDDQAVRDTLDASRRFHDSDRWWERSAGLPADIRRFREAVSPDIAPGAEQPTEGSVLGRAVENIRDYISGTGPHAATPRELDDERQRQEYATTQGGITPSEQVSPILRGRREGATEPSPVSYKGATPEETAAALGPAAGKSVRRKLEQVSAAEGYRPVETRADTVVAPRIGEAGYIPQPEEVGYVKGTPSAPDISLTSDRPAETVRAAYRQFPDDPASREAWLAQQPRDVTIPTAEEQVARKAATEEQFGRQIMLERAAGAKGGGAGIQLEMLRRPEQVRQQEADRALRQATLNQRVQEELGRGGRGFTGEAGKNIRQKMKDDPSLKSLTPEEMQILQDVNRRAAESLQRRGGATEPTQTGGGPKIGDVVKGYRYMGGNPAEQDSWEKV